MEMPILVINWQRTRHGLTFYKMRGEYFVRTKSSLTGKRVKKDPAFRKTMYFAGVFGRAAKIGAIIYKALPANWKQYWMYREFTGEAMTMLKNGFSEEETIHALWKTYVGEIPISLPYIKRNIRRSHIVVSIYNVHKQPVRTFYSRRFERGFTLTTIRKQSFNRLSTRFKITAIAQLCGFG